MFLDVLGYMFMSLVRVLFLGEWFVKWIILKVGVLWFYSVLYEIVLIRMLLMFIRGWLICLYR